MNKRGGQRKWNGPKHSGNSYSSEHDDRDKSRNTTTRRVSFKPSQLSSKGGINGRVVEMAIRTRLEDDEEMSDFIGSKAIDGRRGGRRKGSPIPRGKFGNTRKLIPSNYGWYQVTISYGQKYPKDDLMRNILSVISPDTFVPHYWRAEKTCIIFFVDDFNTAEKIQNTDRKLQMADGFRLQVRVRSGLPLVEIDDNFKEKMKLAMAGRYNASTNALDLSKFHGDPHFRHMFCGLFRTNVMSAAVDIISKNIPNLEAINLNDNQLSNMDSFRNIAQKLPNLKILYLGENRIPSLSSLGVFKGVAITELFLKSNPLKTRFKDNSLYISEVRKRFPKLIRLDEQDLEPQIVFDVNDSLSLPSPKASFFCESSGAEIIRQFLEQYFLIFDSDNRQPLLDAYHEHAIMSLSVPPASQVGRLSSFWKYNRNFMRASNDPDNHRARLLKVGRLPVVSMLSELPKTQHDPLSFSVDLSLFTPKLIVFTVAGLFKEIGSEGSGTSNTNATDIRYFQRHFVIVPAGSGFCIRNELILITSATQSQIKFFLKTDGQVIQSDRNSNITNDTMQAIPTTSQIQQPSINIIDEATKLQMIEAMCNQSKMNMEWSKKCLEETNWNYTHAAFVFEKLRIENKIPPEAFVK